MTKTTEEKIKKHMIDEKKLLTIMKRFLSTKESDPEVTKYFHVENGLHFSATTLGSAVSILFENRFDGKTLKGTGHNFYRKPLPNNKYEDVESIPEIETVAVGKKKVKRQTGKFLEYPDVAAMFAKHDLNEFYEVTIQADDLDQFIAVHEGMEKVSKIGGMYNTAKITISNERLSFGLHDSPVKFDWSYEINQEEPFILENYHYDFSLMTAILKSLKDLKPDEVKMYVKDINNPIIFRGAAVEYNYNFAINRKLVK